VDCRSAESRFEAFLDGQLTTAQRSALLRHVDRCEGCRAVLEELRVVDALLLAPREVPLAPNFTFATMAEVRALPAPPVRRVPVLAYLVSYLAGAWLLVGAAFVLEPAALHSAASALLGIVASVVSVVAGGGRAVGRALWHDGGAAMALMAGILVAELSLVLGVRAMAGSVRS
jgi:anti-sigma factor RsiW